MVWGGGYLGELGVLDFAGGTPVHICSGATASVLFLCICHIHVWPDLKEDPPCEHRLILATSSSAQLDVSQLLAMIIIWG